MGRLHPYECEHGVTMCGMSAWYADRRCPECDAKPNKLYTDVLELVNDERERADKAEAQLQQVMGERDACAKKLDETVVMLQELKVGNKRLREALEEIREIYAGMDGFIAETAPEAYQKRIIEQMYGASIQALQQEG